MPRRLSPTALLSILQPWAEVSEPIYRRIAQLSEIATGQEVLWVGCGAGSAVLWLARKYELHVAGVDPDPTAIENAERTARAAGLQKLVTFQRADGSDLPHETEVFDVTVVNTLQLSDDEGPLVLREAARVTRPMSPVIAIVPSWLSTPDSSDAGAVDTLGLKPRLVVEWKSACRDAGLVELAVENAAKDGRWIASGSVGIVLRGWRAARWFGVAAVRSRPFRTLRSLVEQRVLGLSLIKGTRWPQST